MKKIALFLSCISLCMQSCEPKDYEEQQLSEPAFSITGLRNGEPFTFAAGTDGLIQTAALERNKYGVMEWSSSLIDASCPTCEAAFSLTLNDLEGVDLSDCSELELFSINEMLFASESSTSAYTACELSLNGVPENQEANYASAQSTSLGPNSFSFAADGVHAVSAIFELDLPNTQQENNIEIRQTLYSGAHRRLSAPFNYEMLEGDGNDDQRIRLSFPLLPDLRATRWNINGSLETDPSVLLDIDENTEYSIEIFYVHDATGTEGSYSIQFDDGFPVNLYCNADQQVVPAPSINIDWQTATPNFERAFITCVFNGKTFTSVTPLNASPTSWFNLLNYTPFAGALQGNQAIQVNSAFSVTIVEEGNESNVIELTNCTAKLGFIVP